MDKMRIKKNKIIILQIYKFIQMKIYHLNKVLKSKYKSKIIIHLIIKIKNIHLFLKIYKNNKKIKY